jgi:putative sterol carrier protein
MHDQVPTPENLLDRSVRRLRAEPERVAGLTAKYRFEVTGENGGVWTIDVVDGAASLVRDDPGRADVTVGISSADYLALHGGRLNGFRALMTGRIRVHGSGLLAARLRAILG